MIKLVGIFMLLVMDFNVLKSQELTFNFSKKETPCELGEASVSIITGAQPITFLWSNGAISNTTSDLVAGDYNVKITDNLGKDTTIYFTIEDITCEPIPENHFTPNGDEFNDTWNISRIQYFPNFELFVYNRWGQLIHSQSNIFVPWDGRSLTLPLPDATYYYILYLDKSNKTNVIKGDVSIVR